MDDRLGLGSEDGLANGMRVEQVERDRLGPERPYAFGALEDVEVPITSCPASISWGTSRVPIAPLAPATKTRMTSPFGHIDSISGV